MENILIVGTIRNPDRRFLLNLVRILDSLPKNLNASTYIVESDSNLTGISVLEEAKNKLRNFDFVSLGDLSILFPDRIERLRFSRNEYVKHIKTNNTYFGWKYVVVADLDGMNEKIDSVGIQSSLRLLDCFDGVFANQKHGYYDLYALRCEGWVESDPITDLYCGINLIKSHTDPGLLGKFIFNVRLFNLRTRMIYKRMIRLRKNSDPIRVSSAFGGLGIYKTEVFLECNYSRYEEKLIQSEHVDLHQKAILLGYKFVINPRMINSNWNTHNINRVIVFRLLRNSKILKRIWNKIRG